MDPFITISYVHNKIYELPNMYQKILESVSVLNVIEYIKGLNKLFHDLIVAHFDLEEKEIFPAALAKAELGLEKVVSELIQEHKDIIEKLSRLNEADAKLRVKADVTQKEKDDLIALCTEITQRLTNHAQKEDEEFYPFLKNISFLSKYI
ncbi:MAG: hemerythrin domain-containing protein [Candidatus Omnitrophica bacterium]|nr:hemerythrin domain-containing protein [Candidatus Omnitrophota bacterium]